MTVGVDCSAVETALRGGELGCPSLGCGGRLAPWGWARARSVRGAPGRLRPRRAVCTGCGGTHVLLPASVLLRRADAVTVIGAALLAIHGNLYEVDPALAGARVELVFDPFDLTDIAVRHHGRPAGRAVPFQIGRHVHPKAHTDTAPAATPTGIDYLRLVEDRHTRSLGERLRYAQLTDPAQPSELPEDSPAAGAGAAQHPPPDRDGPHHSAELLTLADHHPAVDPTPGSTTPDAELDAELASFAALSWADPPRPTAAPDSAAPNSEEIR